MGQSQTVRHAQRVAGVWQSAERAINASGLPSHALMQMLFPIDGMDGGRGCEPDVLIQCGEAPSPDAYTIADPLIVIEVVSPSSGQMDLQVKLAAYFQLSSIQHYLIVDPVRRLVIWHARRPEPEPIATRILREGAVRRVPPSLALDAAALVGPETSA